MATSKIEESGTHTRSVVYRLKHTWVIDKFSNFYVAPAESTTSAYPEYPMNILSTPFSCSHDKRIQCRLQLFPKGNSKESEDYISLNFSFTFKEPARVPIKFKLSILNDRNKRGMSHVFTKVYFKTANMGWPKFIERAVLFNKTNGYLANDQLTILWDIEMHCEPVAELARDTSLGDLESLSIAMNREMYGNLLESGDQSDVVLVVNGKELKAHKAILSANSLVFKSMFECDMKEKAEGRVVIEDLTFDVARELLKFIYTGSVELLDCSAEELLSAADKYGLDLLKQICGQYLVGKVTTDNVARFLAYADAHSVNTLKRACMKYIRGHLVEVMLNKDWPAVGELVIEKLRQEEGPQKDEEELLPKKKKVKQDNLEA